MTIWPESWQAILLPDAPLAELVVRGVVIYALLFAAIRVLGRRLVTQLAASDIIVMVLIAVAVRDGITGPYQTVGDAAISAVTILLCDLLVNLLAIHVPLLRRALRHDPVTLVRDGRLLTHTARAHLITRADLMTRIREEGLHSLVDVRRAVLEQDGSISIVPAQ